MRYHWGLAIGHTYSHHTACDPGGLRPAQAVQSDESIRSKSYMQEENSSTCMDSVVDNSDEEAELMLGDREALDWEDSEDSGSDSSEVEKKINGNYTSEDEGNSMDMQDGLGSDPEWIDDD